MRKSLCIAVIGVVGIIFWASKGPQAEDVKPIPTVTQTDEIHVSMAKKFERSQDIMKGLVTSDFQLLKSAATSLKQISLKAPKTVDGDPIDNELYDHFKLEFLRLTTQLEEMAKEENLEGAAYAYQNLTANCLACHSYLTGQ